MKTSWNDLSKEEQEFYSLFIANGCGPKWSRFIQWFLKKFFFAKLFHAKCVQHDFNFDRAGGIYDYLKANWDMTRFVFIDFFTAFLNALYAFIFIFVGLTYLIGITSLGWLSFRFTAIWRGNYRTKEEILHIM